MNRTCVFTGTSSPRFPMSVFSLLALPFLLGSSAFSTETFNVPADAVSITLPHEGATAEISYLNDGNWSAWETVSVENEQDPLLLESNLLMFPKPVEKIRIKAEGDIEAHPITVSRAPVHYQVAATTNPGTPRILSRNEWGADESILYRAPDKKPSTEPPEENGGNNSGTIPARVEDCNTTQFNYPDEFKLKKIVTGDDEGAYRWTRQYSKKVDLIAVHHTAVKVTGDTRSGAERIRALYEYHANNRGWGDVGYHYLIDEDGQIYEGKSGGKYVVGGHAYCNNINTIGVALLGNFEEEKPTQDQLKALQWLLGDLAETYNIDPSKNIKFHGKTTPPIVGHGDLLSTECPGFYVIGSMAQIREHVASGNTDASVKLPVKPGERSSRSSKKSSRSASSAARAPKRATGELSRAAQRALERQSSLLLRRKLRDGMSSRNASSISRPPATMRLSSSSRSASRRSSAADASLELKIRLTRQETGATSCDAYDLGVIGKKYRGTVECRVISDVAALINTVDIEDYMIGIAEEPDTEPYEKQRAFAIAARTYAAYYADPAHPRKFPGMPYDGSDSPATFQLYMGKEYEAKHPMWVKAVKSTAGEVLTVKGDIIRAPYYSANDGRTRAPAEAGWNNFPFAEVFASKPDPWCAGETLRGHGVGMSGCGAEGQANEGKTGEEILSYYYPGTLLTSLNEVN